MICKHQQWEARAARGRASLQTRKSASVCKRQQRGANPGDLALREPSQAPARARSSRSM
jgi:hypothetical protein